MLKKYMYVIVVSMIVFLNVITCRAYNYVNSNNKNEIEDIIQGIFDSKELYEELAGKKTGSEPTLYDASNNSYWWPIGSVETVEIDGVLFANGEPESTHITSYFGYRDPIYRNGVQISGGKAHGALDIANSRGPNTTNIIAARDGVVVYPNNVSQTKCVDGGDINCGGKYGNYIIIQHSDGNYTLYGHLAKDSVLVFAGQSVRQGQVIAKMGTTGNSTGTHLHFEVREGENSYGARVDPLNYVSPDDPRPASLGGEFLDWLNSWEGHTGISGDSYIVVDIGDGVTTVGHGVTLEYNIEYFKKYGIDATKYKPGDLIPISIVDKVENDELNYVRSYIENKLAKNGITLSNNQLEGLTARMYNTGNINNFVEAYKKYGNTMELYDNWFFSGYRAGSKFETGLKRRRNAEWALFYNGEYVYNR